MITSKIVAAELRAAMVTSAEGYDGPVVVDERDECFLRGTMWSSVDALLGEAKRIGSTPPAWVWAATYLEGEGLRCGRADKGRVIVLDMGAFRIFTETVSDSDSIMCPWCWHIAKPWLTFNTTGLADARCVSCVRPILVVREVSIVYRARRA